MQTIRLFMFVAVLLSCGRAEAFTSGKPDIDTLRTMAETEVTARGVDRRVSASHQEQTVTRADIEALGLTNVGQALARMAGTQVRDYGGIGGMKTVSVHSLGAAHTGVTYDGVVVSDCQAGQIDVGRFFIDNLAEIGLSVGHGDDMLLSAAQMASASMLRLTSSQPRFATDAARHSLRSVVRVGSWGEVSPAVMYAWRTRSGSTLGANAMYQRADGHYPFTLTNGDNPLHYRRDNTDIQCGAAELNWSGAPWRGARIEAKAYGYMSERGLPGSAIYYNNVSHQRLWDTNGLAQVRLTQSLGRWWTVQARAKYNYSYNKYQDRDSKYRGGLRTDRYAQNEGYASVTALWQPCRAWAVALSEDVRCNTLEMRLTNTPFEPDPSRLVSLTAVQARFTAERVSVNGSLLFTAAHETVSQGDAMDVPARLSPSLALTVRPWLSQRLFLRAMYKDTYRLPSFNDLYYDRIGNTQLRPERATEWSLGTAWEHGSGALHLSLTADAYIHRVHDKIVAMPGVYVWHMMNCGTVHISGLDATMRAQWDVVRGVTMDVCAAYTYQRAIDRTRPDENCYGHQLPYTPRHSGSVSATVATPWLCAGWSMQVMGERYAMKVNTTDCRVAGFTVHDINVWREFRWRGVGLRAQLSLCNVADRQYDIIRYYPMPGRHVRGTMTLRL